MDMQIPTDLIFADSNVSIYLDRDGYLNRTASSVVIEANRHGFLSLSNCLIYLANALEDTINLSLIPFITSEIDFVIAIDESVAGQQGGVVMREQMKYVWRISEAESNAVFTGIHSMGHLNSELHLDSGKRPEDLSVYCFVR